MPQSTTDQPTTEDHPEPRTTDELQATLVDALNLDVFPRRGYRDADYLTEALEAGFEVIDIATAHDVSRRSIYRAADEHGIDIQRPPTTGPAKRLLEMDADAVSGESA